MLLCMSNCSSAHIEYQLLGLYMKIALHNKPMHLDIPNVPFAGCAVDSIGMLPTTTKDYKFALTFICLLTSYVIAVPLKIKDSRVGYNGISEGNITKNIMQLKYLTG